jgi:hypothetical protein
MTRIVCVADLHEHLVDVPACDVLLIAGDVSFAVKDDLRAKHAFLVGPFREWLERVPADEVVLVARNMTSRSRPGASRTACVATICKTTASSCAASESGDAVAAVVSRLGLQRSAA